MSVIQSAVQAVVKKAVELVPDEWLAGGKPDPLIERTHGLIGTSVSRLDGPLKVRGEAPFAAEISMDRMAYAALAYSTVAKGRMTDIDTAAAEAAPGVVLVMTHRNAPRLQPPPLFMTAAKAASGDSLPIMQNDRINWNGQPIAIVLAETQDQADHAQSLIRVTYETEPAVTVFAEAKKHTHPGSFQGEPLLLKIGDAEAALAASPHKVDVTYLTPRHNHNAIELHAATLAWEGDNLIVHDSVQGVAHVAWSLAQVFWDQGNAGSYYVSVRRRRVWQQDAVATPGAGSSGIENRRSAGAYRIVPRGGLPSGRRADLHRAAGGNRGAG